jgi:cytochrome c-type protein NapB
MRQSCAIVAVVSVLVLGLAYAAEEPAAENGIPDSDVSLRRASVFETPTPSAVPENESAPGELPPIPPPNEEAPTVIPHGIGDFLPITADSNMCVDCHGVEEKEEGEPTPIPASHYVDLRNAPEEKRAKVAGARYLCVSCHVSQTAVEPLVANSTSAPDDA